MDYNTFCTGLSQSGMFYASNVSEYAKLKNGTPYYADPGGSEAYPLDSKTIKVTLHNPFLGTDKVKHIKITTVQKTEFVVV